MKMNNIFKLKKILILSLFLLILSGCSSSNSFVSNYKFDYIDDKDEVELPMYFYGTDFTGNIISEDLLNIKETTQKVKFSDFKITDINNEEMLISFRMDISSFIDSHYNKDLKDINYVFTYITPLMFDYHTADIYKYKMDKINSEEQFTDPSNINKDSFKNSVIKYEDKNINVYVNIEALVETSSDDITQEDEGDNRKHLTSPITSSVRVNVIVPKDYDGVMLALDKEGSSKEEIMKSLEKTNNKDNNSSDKLNKLIDKDNESRKNYTEDRYYVMDISNVLGIRNNSSNLIIFIIIFVVIITSLVVVLLKKKKKM